MNKIIAMIGLYLLAALMFASAVGHVVNPEFYRNIIPPFVGEDFANISATVVEAVIGIGLLLPGWRRWAGLAFCGLMIAFLPLHVWDLTRANPAMGSTLGAAVRLLVQLGLIFAGWKVWKMPRK